MTSALSGMATRVRVVVSRLLRLMGLGDDAFLTLLAVLIGAVTAAAAVGFHELIDFVRDRLYQRPGARVLYGPGLLLLVLWPALGGLVVGMVSRYVARTREGRGIIDVIESVIRSRGFIKPTVAIEKIFTSAVTIGTGGSCGAEGPIVQIGAAIASGFGQLFRLARQQMPIVIGCGAAAGISAIFNSPIGGVLFTLEVILQDFSIRTFTPVVVASVIANVTVRAIFFQVSGEEFRAIFALPPWEVSRHAEVSWGQLGNYVILGGVCGLAGVALTRFMVWTERQFARLEKLGAWRPALGGLLLGLSGVAYVMIFGWGLMGRDK
ncbi:MAG: chloride channel protein, partial [Tepidisphaeraceae bacterium]